MIDEEHKFGVKHKEIIKSLKENIDVLSLTATPIPRTLNSALSEIKDMSIINTPPVGRKNIDTNIINKSSEELEIYINREINRGGQILFVHNNIETMQQEIGTLQEIPGWPQDREHPGDPRIPGRPKKQGSKGGPQPCSPVAL